MSAAPRPFFVLLPGLDGSGHLFAPFMEAWRALSHRTENGCVVVSLPRDRHIPYAELPAHVLAGLPAAARKGPVVVLGESCCGPLALRLAAQCELDVRAVVMVASFARYPRNMLRLLASLSPLSWLLRLPLPSGLLRHYCFGDAAGASLLQQLREAVAANVPRVMAQRLRDALRIDVRPELEKITVPVLYLRPEDDRLVPASALAPLRAGLRDLQIVTLAGPHFILQTRPRECARVIDDLFRRLPRTQ